MKVAWIVIGGLVCIGLGTLIWYLWPVLWLLFIRGGIH